MAFSRRQWLKTGAAGAMAAGLAGATPAEAAQQGRSQGPARSPLFDKLQPLGDRAKPITVAEMQERVARAQQLMRDANPKFDALYVAPGSSMYYYFGVRWGLSERLFAFVLPRSGDAFLVCPAFEEGRARELLRWEMPVRVWQEDQSPYVLVARTLADRGIRSGRIGVEEHTRFTFFDGLRKAATGFEFPSADPVTIGCRGRKTAHELELMRLANHATIDVYRAVFDSLREGMTQSDVGALIRQGFQRMGLQGGALVLFGQWAALPHGTRQPQQLKEGEVVLVDGGTSVEGYASDVTRTTVLGQPSEKLRAAFNTVRRRARQDHRLRRRCRAQSDHRRGLRR
jgi:Xaa-Pro dipeptidase